MALVLDEVVGVMVHDQSASFNLLLAGFYLVTQSIKGDGPYTIVDLVGILSRPVTEREEKRMDFN
jgi:hypothetical protein